MVERAALVGGYTFWTGWQQTENVVERLSRSGPDRSQGSRYYMAAYCPTDSRR